MKKMRLLTFMQLAEGNTEMSFDTIQKELQIEEDQVEAFIIDGKSRLILLTYALLKSGSSNTCELPSFI